MPVPVLPNRIELSEFSGGFSPDGEEASLPLESIPDAINLLLDTSTGALELRKGFTRLSAGRLEGQGGYYIRHVNYYECIDSGTRKRFLICVLTNGTDAEANNVKLYAYDLINNTFNRIDTAGRSWAKAKTEHWFAIVENTYYGGTRGEEIYSWHPTNGWDADPTTPNVDTWVDAIGNSVAASGEKGRNFAFKKGMKVVLSGKYYSALRNIRFKTWESGESYRKGERVSRKVNHGTRTYWRSFEAKSAHTAESANAPGTGASEATYWKTVRLKNIKDEDGDITSDWAYMPLPGKGSVGTYHGFRLFVSHPDSDNRGRVQYSAPAKPERDALIADLDFRPTDWAPVDDNRGDGGGWFTVPFSKGDALRGLYSYGTYLIIFGRWQSFVLAGTNENTWTLRELGKAGALAQASVVEHQGLVYFLSPTGTLFVTDGTSVQPAPGFEKVREWVKDRIDQLMIGQDNYNWHPSIESYGGYIWISLPDNDPNTTANQYTLVYDPATQTYWLTSIPMLSMAVGEKGRAQRAWFSAPITGADTDQKPTVFQYLDDPGNEVYTDDDWTGEAASAETNDISWHFRSAWLQFGVTRNERRIRRLWALVTGETADVVTVAMYRNFEADSARTTAARTLVGSAAAEFIEGKVGTTDAYSVGVKVSAASNAQTALHGVGVDTEPRRTRFHH